MRRFTGIALGFAIAAAPAAAQTIGAPGTGQINAWGNYATPTYGQTITSPGGNLTSFSFWLIGANPNTFYKAYVASWSNSLYQAVGTPLFVGATTSGVNGQNTVSGLNIAMTAGQTYVLALTASTTPDQSALFWGFNWFANYYTGGHMVWSNYLSLGNLNAGQWDGGPQWWNSPDDDLQFEATFNAAPEPTTLMLLGSGLTGMAGIVRRRRQRNIES